MKISVLLFLFVSFITFSFVYNNINTNETMSQPGEGIKFKGMNLEEAKKEAKAKGKLIFIDAYTDWCGPCKRMAATSFKDEKVAEVFNDKFINLKIEMEKSTDGPTVARTYGVKAYPTLLFIDADGKVKKTLVGLQTSEQLIAVAKSL
jgi:thioredoxin 1